MKDLFELKREFLEFCELDKGQSDLTIENYDRYLSRFLSWLRSEKKGANSGVISSHPEPTPRVDSREATFDIAQVALSASRRARNPATNVVMGSSRHPAVSRTPQDDNKTMIFPADITQEIVRQYRLHVNRLTDNEGKPLKQNTQNYHFLAIRAFLRFLGIRGYQAIAPEKISIAKQGDREVSFLEGEEIQRILEVPNTDRLVGLRDRALLELLFSTGMRVSEIAGLTIDDVNFNQGEIVVMGKGKKLRVVFVSDSALHWLDQYIKNQGFLRPGAGTMNKKVSQPLFISPKGEALTVRSIQRIVSNCAKKAGISKPVTPHTLRHSFATDLLRSGADIRSVQSLLGHSSITTTQVYTHVTDQHLREIHRNFHGKSLEPMKEEGAGAGSEG